MVVISSESTEEATTAKIDEDLTEEAVDDDVKDGDWKADKKTPGGTSRTRHFIRLTPKFEDKEKMRVK